MFIKGMASIHQIRGALLEEVVLFLLGRSGYRRVLPGEEGTGNGPAGLVVEGRGSEHQIDALVTPLYSHPFVYPIRLMVEAKCEAKPVNLRTVRSVVGTLSDINQNYFAARVRRGREVRVQRFNYHAAMFAANGYSDNTERYALAHQVFLIDYSHVALMRPIVDALLALEFEDFGEPAQGRMRPSLTETRNGFRAVLEREAGADRAGIFSERGIAKLRDRLLPALQQLRGSYYGMVEGIYPVHLISRREIPIRLILERPVIPCAIHFSDNEQTWAFEPSEILENSEDFFRLEFTIPEFIADMLNARPREGGEQPPRWLYIANLKQEYMRFIDITTISEGRLVGFRLVLDLNWLNRYVDGRQAREDRHRGRREPQG
jgi:hypothetical protein